MVKELSVKMFCTRKPLRELNKKRNIVKGSKTFDQTNSENP